DREMVIRPQRRLAGTGQHVERGIECPLPADEGLTGQQVVAERGVVVPVLPVTPQKVEVAKLLRLREAEVAGLSIGGLHEQPFADVIGQAGAVDGLGTKVLDTEQTDVGPDLEIGAIDLRRLHATPLDGRIDDRSSRIRLGNRGSGRTDETAGRRAGSEQSDEHGPQKKNANPAFHSSTSSFSSRLVNTR